MVEKICYQFDVDTYRMLLSDWVAILCESHGLAIHQRSRSSNRFILGSQESFHIEVSFTNDSPYLKFQSSELNKQNDIDAAVAQAIKKLDEGDLGSLTWYSSTLVEPKHKLSAHPAMSSILFMLSDRISIKGWFRIGRNILLEFKDDIPADPDIRDGSFIQPRSVIDVHVAIPGPYTGEFSNSQAQQYLEKIEAICSFALGRIVDLPTAYFPSHKNIIEKLNHIANKPTLCILNRRNISLDIFEHLINLGGIESFYRASAALTTFSAAMRQERDPIACMLYVISAEVLTNPFTSWKREKLTKRFVCFYEELMPTY